MLHMLRVITVLLVAFALVPAGAHLFSMASKLRLDADGYLAAQRAYDGWSLFGVVVIAALASTLALTVALYRSGEAFVLPGLAALCMAGTQALFWAFTYPMNKATSDWTMLPAKWEFMRLQWEISHAASAGLNAVALVLLVLATVKD